MGEAARTLEGKVALITGTGGGQGRAAAIAFAEAGARVLGCDLNTEQAIETVDIVRSRGGEMLSVQPVDLADPGQANDWIGEAVYAWGGVDIVYNNAAALFARGPFATSTLEQWDLTIRNELTIVYVVCRAAWPHLIDRGGGVIINTASVSGHLEFHPMRSAAHGAAKAGVLGLTRMLAIEGAEFGIRAVSVSPGVTRAPATRRFWEGTPQERAMGDALISRVPAGRAAEPEDIAQAALFLASPAAAYINGTDLLVDGGVAAGSYRSS